MGFILCKAERPLHGMELKSPKTNTLADGLIKRTLSMLDETESKTVDKDEVGDR